MSSVESSKIGSQRADYPFVCVMAAELLMDILWQVPSLENLGTRKCFFETGDQGFI